MADTPYRQTVEEAARLLDERAVVFEEQTRGRMEDAAARLRSGLAEHEVRVREEERADCVAFLRQLADEDHRALDALPVHDLGRAWCAARADRLRLAADTIERHKGSLRATPPVSQEPAALPIKPSWCRTEFGCSRAPTCGPDCHADSRHAGAPTPPVSPPATGDGMLLVGPVVAWPPGTSCGLCSGTGWMQMAADHTTHSEPWVQPCVNGCRATTPKLAPIAPPPPSDAGERRDCTTCALEPYSCGHSHATGGFRCWTPHSGSEA